MEDFALFSQFQKIWNTNLLFGHNSMFSCITEDDTGVSSRTMSVFLQEQVRTVHPKVENYCEETVESMSDTRFKEHFRLERKTFKVVCSLLLQDKGLIMEFFPHEFNPKAESSSYNPPISFHKSLLIAIWYLANNISMRDVGDRFGVAKSTVFNCVRKCCSILTRVADRFIVWPYDTGDCQEIISNFEEISGFPNVLGAIDGCHIPVICAADEQVAYRNRKCGHSMVLQGIRTSNKMFIDVSTGYPGSIHDARILKNTGIYEKAVNSIESVFKVPNSYLVGDSAYPLLNWLMVPFKDFGALTRQQKRYNKKLSRARVTIENAYGLLKGRFRKLRMLDCDMDFAPFIIIACCVLHNICQTEGDAIQEWYETNLDAQPDSDGGLGMIASNNRVTVQAQNIRDRIVASL